jgi:hypothetical protein
MSSSPHSPNQRTSPATPWLLAFGLAWLSATATAQTPQAPQVPVMTMGAQAVGAGLEMDGSL